MIGIANNYDALCYHLKVVRGGLNSPIKNKIDSLLQAIRYDLLNSDTHLLDAIEANFSLILNLRIAALKWLSTHDKDLNDLLDNEAYPYFEQLTQIDRLSCLSENILFALRCNKKVISALFKNNDQEELFRDSSNNLPEEMPYDQFISSFYLILPTVDVANLLIEWTQCSFKIEYIICATAIIFDEKLLVTPEKLNELSSIIADAAQTYTAIAMEIGILPFQKVTRQSTDIIDKSAFLEEQKKLAEAGIQLFSRNWNN